MNPALTVNGIEMVRASWRLAFLSVMALEAPRLMLRSLPDIRGEVSGHGSQLLAPRPPVVSSAAA
jgi:hypothetical protein